MDARTHMDTWPLDWRPGRKLALTIGAVAMTIGITSCSGGAATTTADSTSAPPATAAESASSRAPAPSAGSASDFLAQGVPKAFDGQADPAPGVANTATLQTIADSAGLTSATTPTYWPEILNEVLNFDKWGTTYWYGATTDNSNFAEGDFSSPGAAFFVTGTTQYPIEDMANFLINFLALPQNCTEVGPVSAPEDFTTYTAVASASFGCGPAGKAVYVRVMDWGIAGLQVGSVVTYYDDQERQDVAQTLSSFTVDPSDAAPGSNSGEQGTVAEAMASGSGYGFGVDACYEAELTQADPAFGTIRLSDYGEANRAACQSIDAQVAIVHQGTSGWEMVDYFLSPDCASARENLARFGASEAVVQEIIGAWPC